MQTNKQPAQEMVLNAPDNEKWYLNRTILLLTINLLNNGF